MKSVPNWFCSPNSSNDLEYKFKKGNDFRLYYIFLWVFSFLDILTITFLNQIRTIL